MKKFSIILVLSLTVFLLGCGSEKNADTDFAASIIELEGQVESRPDMKTPYRKGTKDEKLFNGSMIKTGKDGKASLKFVDSSSVVVFPDSFFEVSAGKTFGKQHEGKAVYNMQKQQSEIEIQTNHGVTAVLGTKFLIEVASDSFVLIVDEGRVRFTRKIDGEKIELGMGEKIAFKTDSAVPAKLEIQKLDPITREKIFNSNTKVYINY